MEMDFEKALARVRILFATGLLTDNQEAALVAVYLAAYGGAKGFSVFSVEPLASACHATGEAGCRGSEMTKVLRLAWGDYGEESEVRDVPEASHLNG